MNPLASEQALQTLTEAGSKQLTVLTEKPWLGFVSNILQLTKAWELPRPCHIPLMEADFKNSPVNMWLSNLPV